MPENNNLSFREQMGEFLRNRQNFPLEELAKYAGKHIAYSLDGNASWPTARPMRRWKNNCSQPESIPARWLGAMSIPWNEDQFE